MLHIFILRTHNKRGETSFLAPRFVTSTILELLQICIDNSSKRINNLSELKTCIN